MDYRTLLLGTAAFLGLALVEQAFAAPPVRTVEIAVTSDGFVPPEIRARRGQPLKLVVTRKTERTCATEIVMKDFGVNRPLPLNQPVVVTITPKKAGEYRYACGMDMIAGVLKVE